MLLVPVTQFLDKTVGFSPVTVEINASHPPTTEYEGVSE